jgi:two-component system, cell cycle sensor histidine kinase and response regulator CckA
MGGDLGVVLDEAFWRSLCRALGDGIDGSLSCIDRQRRVLFLSRSRTAAPSDAIGKRIDELVPPLERAALLDCIERAFELHEPQRVEHDAISADGRRVRSSTRVVPFAGPRREELALQITTKVTERDTARMLDQSGEFERQIVHHLPDFVAVVDRTYRFVWLNHVAPGLDPADIIGTTIDAFVTAEGAARAHAAIDAAFATLRSQHYEVEGPGADGSHAWYAVRVVPITTASAMRYVLLITTDVTERRRAAEALREKEEQLQRAQHRESLGQLAGGIAHDFNNLLQVIEGTLSFVKEGLRRGELPIDDLEQALRATERAGELTSRLLAVGRRSRVAPQRVELGALVEQEMRMLRRVIPENVELSYEKPARPVFVAVDPSSFEQVLINLCVRARDAMPQGGKLELGIAADGAEQVVLSVSDTGESIPAEHLTRIFEPFFAAHGADRGLGLAVAAGLMAAQGGDITAHGDGRGGTTMKLRLPRSADAAPESVSPSELSLQGSGLILVAEDEDLVRAQVVRILSRAGYVVLQASNGAQAVDMFREHADTIDLVVLDVVMPVLDGWRAYQRLLELRPGVKVIFTTGYAANVLPPDFAARGARLLAKPYKRQDLLAEVRDVLAPVGALDAAR